MGRRFWVKINLAFQHSPQYARKKTQFAEDFSEVRASTGEDRVELIAREAGKVASIHTILRFQMAYFRLHSTAAPFAFLQANRNIPAAHAADMNHRCGLNTMASIALVNNCLLYLSARDSFHRCQRAA